MPSKPESTIPLPGDKREDSSPPVTSVAFTEPELRHLARLFHRCGCRACHPLTVRVISAWAEAVAA